MAKKEKKETGEKLEREYIIPLRRKFQHVPRYKKTPKAVKSIKEFLARHMKIRDRDLKKIKIDRYVNEFMWARSIKNPPHKIKVKSIKDGENIRVELVDYPDKLKFKKLREEKKELKAKEAGKKKAEKKEETPAETTETTETEEDKKETEEKKAAVVEAGQKMAKQQAKQSKHQVGGKQKQKTQPQRMSLQK